MPDSHFPERLPDVADLQFRRAQPVDSPAAVEPRACAACKQLIGNEYYQVQNHVICPPCAGKIQAGAQSKKTIPWVRLVIFGGGAALAGSLLYAIVLAMGVQIGIVALAVGWMVGKAIRHASYGVGGRPHQILAVALTYFAISTSFLPAAFFIGAKQGVQAKKRTQEGPPKVVPAEPKISIGTAAAGLLMLATVSPFLELASSPVGGLISLFILFIGLQRAWALTAGHAILVTGPFPCSP